MAEAVQGRIQSASWTPSFEPSSAHSTDLASAGQAINRARPAVGICTDEGMNSHTLMVRAVPVEVPRSRLSSWSTLHP